MSACARQRSATAPRHPTQEEAAEAEEEPLYLSAVASDAEAMRHQPSDSPIEGVDCFAGTQRMMCAMEAGKADHVWSLDLWGSLFKPSCMSVTRVALDAD